MKFAYVTEVDLSLDNGPGINEREFVTALLDISPDVICITPRPSKPENHYDKRIKYLRVSGSSRIGRNLSFARSVFHWAKAARDREEVAGIGVRIGVLPILPIILEQRLGVPVFLKTLAGYGLLGADAELRFKLMAPVLRPLYRRAISKATISDTVSHAYVAWLNHQFGVPIHKLTLVPNGANTKTFVPGPSEVAKRAHGLDRFDRIVGYVGALHGWRDLFSLVDAFAAARLPESTGLVLVGAGPSREQIEAHVNQIGIADRVVFKGQVPYSHVPELMRSFDLAVDLTVIAMKVGARTEYGSFSQKIPQYLASGVPVVTWSVPDNAFIDDAGVGRTIRHGDRMQLAEAFESLLSLDNMQLAAMRQRARSYAETAFSSENLAARRLDLWRSCVSPSLISSGV